MNMPDKCALCGSSDPVKLCRVEYIPGSAGVIRPVCDKCLGETEKIEEQFNG